MKQLPQVEEAMTEITKEIAKLRPRVIPEEVKSFAPPIHPDRISQTTRIMCEAIDRIYEDTAAGIDKRVADFAAKVDELNKNAQEFKRKMRTDADGLVEKIKAAMANYEDITTKMLDSSFGHPITKLIEPPSEGR